MKASRIPSSDVPAIAAASPSRARRSAHFPATMAPESRAAALAPPAPARSKRVRPTDAPGSATRARERSRSRCPYSSSWSSPASDMHTFESVPTPNEPPRERKVPQSKIPSPRLASVIGQSPTTAPERARTSTSQGIVRVQWMRHQRRSTGRESSSQVTGRAPRALSTSRTSSSCSAAWIWIGPSGSMDSASRMPSPSTARKEWGAHPNRASSGR